jgi:hypothetical protein
MVSDRGQGSNPVIEFVEARACLAAAPLSRMYHGAELGGSMIESARLAPPYSIVFIEDVSGGEVPDFTERSLIAATGSCIMVCTLCEIDGATEFLLGPRSEVDPGTQPVFQGQLETPSRKLAIFSVPVAVGSGFGDIVLETSVPRDETIISIWANRPTEPDQIIIGVE